ncbi:MAG TPA: DUF3089 domain-containing protein [Allosphingosinicella sp.]|jgi:hypothetical protein
MKLVTAAAAAALAWATPLPAQEPAPDYAQDSAWLCLPEREGPCTRPLPTTALNANGYGSVGQAVPAADAPVDCFYVYPTVSGDPGLNADLKPGPEEDWTAWMQAARFSGVCRVYAPLYRQATNASMMAEAPLALAYGDVLAAWRQYLGQRNRGRPFVLVGHSQGAIHLVRLLASEIEGRPEADRMLSAILVGWNVEVPVGQRVGGSFKRTPLCSRVGETGCVIAWTSYRATNPPPPAGTPFGRTATPAMTVACTNPARFSRGTAPLDSYWPTGVSLSGGPDTIKWSTGGAPPTPFVRTDGLASAACVNRPGAGYLSVIVNGDPADARTDEIPGDLVIGGRAMREWGLHLAEMNLAQGDLIALVEAQAEAFSASATPATHNGAGPRTARRR